jgi:class 3 adenylate cyclase
MNTSPLAWELTQEIAALREEAESAAMALREEKQTNEARAATIERLQKVLAQFARKEGLEFLLSRMGAAGQRRLIESEEFRTHILRQTECMAFVISIDIRRSTELMLRARTPRLFAEFIVTVCAEIEALIKENHGIVGKFTGDGELAFFPDFFSGTDAGYLAVSVAEKCHQIFARQYRDLRGSFTTVPVEVSLGIGIDFGRVDFVRLPPGLRAVGAPVVYACRLSEVGYGQTLLNQAAYEKIRDQFGALCSFRERQLEIKHEGLMHAYEVKLNGVDYNPVPPPWMKEMSAAKKA